MLYDGKCWDLAVAFLSDVAGLSDAERVAHADLLAQEIQTTIEDYISVEVEAAVLRRGEQGDDA
jgi:hypothetical protein